MSHRTVREMSSEERQELDRMTQEALGRVALRAHMVLLSARGYSAQEIAEIHTMSDVTAYTAVSRRREIDRFNEEGPDGLYDREREGRPPKIDQEAEDEIERVLAAPPTEEGYNASRWTSPRLAQHLKEKLGRDVVHHDSEERSERTNESTSTRPDVRR